MRTGSEGFGVKTEERVEVRRGSRKEDFTVLGLSEGCEEEGLAEALLKEEDTGPMALATVSCSVLVSS